MKKLILLVTGLLLSTNSVIAAENPSENLNTKDSYRYSQPIMFVERGVEFLIFPDGSFDFNTNADNNYHDDVYYRNNSRRSGINVSYKGPHANIQYTSGNYENRGVSISRDRDGKIRSIGDVYLNYDRYGNITRAGSVFINYSRGHHSILTQVGGLYVNYNYLGEIVNTHGQVNRYSNYCHYCGVSSCKIDHSHHDKDYDKHNDKHYDKHEDDRDDNYYYYKQNGKVKKQKKNKR